MDNFQEPTQKRSITAVAAGKRNSPGKGRRILAFPKKVIITVIAPPNPKKRNRLSIYHNLPRSTPIFRTKGIIKDVASIEIQIRMIKSFSSPIGWRLSEEMSMRHAWPSTVSREIPIPRMIPFRYLADTNCALVKGRVSQNWAHFSFSSRESSVYGKHPPKILG